AAFHVFQPDAGPGQAVGGLDVIHEEAVDELNRRLFINVSSKQVGVPRFRATIAADIKVVALFSGDKTEVFALGLGALAHAAGDGGFDFVRGANAAVAFFDTNGEADGILHAVAAPGGADAALHGSERLSVGVTTFHASVDDFFPNVRKLLDLRSEQIDALA